MAYIKTKSFPNGFSASYWRITSVPANKIAKETKVTVHGYKDQATRQAGGNPITYLTFNIPTESLDFSKDLFSQAYEYIKDKKDASIVFNPNAEAFFADAVVD